MTLETYLTNICKHSGVDPEAIKVELTEDDTMVTATITLPEDDSGLFIGYHGETLAGIQRLARVIFQKDVGEKKIVVNVNGYREQRQEKLREMTDVAAQRVLESGRPYTFSYLPSHERYIIHASLSENPAYAELESVSEGEGKHRVLIIRSRQSHD